MTARELATEHLGAEYFSDPYAVHARLRARGPVTPVVLPGGDARVADHRVRRGAGGAGRPAAPQEHAGLAAGARLGRSPSSSVHMLDSDPPDHGRLRRLVNKAFTARRVDRLRPRITAITGALLDGLAGRSEVDLLASFAFPLPITVICELLGVPAADRDDFRTWSTTVVVERRAPPERDARPTPPR